MDASQFIGMVEHTDVNATALERVTTAVRLGDEVCEAADNAVRHFVDAARRAGHSWTEIGGRLGVSKQAARQRFAESVSTPAVPEIEFRPRLRSCLDAARREAESDGAAEPGSQHLLLGLFAEGYAANLLDQLSLTRERTRAEVGRLFPGPATPDSDDCLAAATAFARERGDRQVGTEHLLYVLAHDLGSRAYRVLAHLGVAAAIRRELRCFGPARGRRWKRLRARSAMSPSSG